MHTHLYAYTHTYTQSITYTAVLYALTLLGPPSVTFKEVEGTMLWAPTLPWPVSSPGAHHHCLGAHSLA